MASNISKYIQLNDFLLLEYEFNKDSFDSTGLPGITHVIADTHLGTRQYFNTGSMGVLNNDLRMNSVPTAGNRSSWYVYPQDTSEYWSYFDSSTAIGQPSYRLDTLKIHIVSGYNFDDVPGFLLQIGAKDTSNKIVDLSNFTWINQELGTNVRKFSPNALYLANRFYDKYVQLRIPSVQELGGDTTSNLGQALSIQALSDVYITYSTIPEIDGDTYIIQERISLQLPVASQADNFNAFIAESTAGDFIEFYATWNHIIIGEYMSDIESGRIKLYTSNNPNDNFEEFSDVYGAGASKWVVMHEIYVYEEIPGNLLQTQRYVFTQENNFNLPNYFRPVIKNADIASSYTIEYICRLTNRMDGSQIIRKASLTSHDPQKYGRFFTRLNIDNYIPYKVFNRLEGEASTTVNMVDSHRTKFVKVFYDSTNVLLNMENQVLPQGTGPLFLKRGDGTYKFSFEKIDQHAEDERINVDLSGAFNYSLLFVLDDDTKIEIQPTYSRNMNSTLGELEFKIMETQTAKLLKQNNNSYSIVVKNPDGTSYTFYEGFYFAYSNFDQVISQYTSLFEITDLQSQIASLEAENQALQDQIAADES
jgi:hypothetical protein